MWSGCFFVTLLGFSVGSVVRYYRFEYEIIIKFNEYEKKIFTYCYFVVFGNLLSNFDVASSAIA